jgi:hypothetical protein
MKRLVYGILIMTGGIVAACGNNTSQKPSMDVDTSKKTGDTADKFNNNNGIQHDSSNKPLDSTYHDSLVRELKKKRQ